MPFFAKIFSLLKLAEYFSNSAEKLLAQNPANFALALAAVQQLTVDFPKKQMSMVTDSGPLEFGIDEDERLVCELLREALSRRFKYLR